MMPSTPEPASAIRRSDTQFAVVGSTCAAWLFRPAATETESTPCVVMAHGFSGVREQRLDAYADRFAQAGIAVLLFDYRHFGASAGEPRQLLSIRRQLQDWEAAVAHARSLPGIDPARIGLFGSSLSGGHVQTIAARDARIAATVAQVPFCDGLRTLPALGLVHTLRLTLAGLRDLAGTLFGLPPYRIAAVGKAGELAAMTTPDAVSGFLNMNPPGSNWRNEVCARIGLELGSYRPGAHTDQIHGPILYCIAEQDSVTPARFAHEAAARAPHAEVQRYDCGHFDVYIGALWETVVADQTAFLVKHLLRGN